MSSRGPTLAGAALAVLAACGARAGEAARAAGPARALPLEEAAAGAPGPPKLPVLVLSLGPQLGSRKVTWRDRVTPSLASYQSGTQALVEASAELYPFANRLPWPVDLGLVGAAGRSAPVRTTSADGSSDLTGLWHAWDAGLRLRAVIAGEERGGLSLRYGSLRYDLSGPRPAGALLPAGTLQYWRPGLDGRVALGPVVLSASAGWLALVVQDAIGRAFPRSSGGGLDGALQLALPFGRRFEARLSGRYTRFFYSLRPLPGDPYVAGGALDEYATAALTLAFRT